MDFSFTAKEFIMIGLSFVIVLLTHVFELIMEIIIENKNASKPTASKTEACLSSKTEDSATGSPLPSKTEEEIQSSATEEIQSSATDSATGKHIYENLGPLPAKNAYQEIMKHNDDDKIKLYDNHETLSKVMKQLMERFGDLLKEEKNVLITKVPNVGLAKPRNRYADILPFEYNRVHLHPKVEESDYINASIVDGIFIATQGPQLANSYTHKQNTIGHFWFMVWQNNVSTIVMLTNFVENDKKKCADYFGAESGDYNETFDDDERNQLRIKFETEKIKKTEVYVIREFELTFTNNQGETETRIVKHFHFTAWPDMGVPKQKEFVEFYDACKRRIDKSIGQKSKVVVHCSAGVGRTGTFIAYDWMARQGMKNITLGELNEKIIEMKTERMKLVQVEIQYEFLIELPFYCINNRENPYENLASSSEASVQRLFDTNL